ncbi:IS200/IS605 family accessory protein TnpB-related protein [Siminovitchia fortis]|uniref:transposase n=1 Tax=Siminovitchia fortis TaxID=254758 RepID=UPI001F4230EB|nr:transposase [Siminovitchia fortis]WHY83636.1 IS200/IS605 family accessory protein TnpB-related protein [Siminovitchia fortis]
MVLSPAVVRFSPSSRQLAKSISDFSWSLFIEKLEYKAEWYGKKVVKIDRWYS